MKKIYIVGYNGNMARRYRAILDYLDISHCGEDVGHRFGRLDECQGVIITTPTNMHLWHLDQFERTGLPILCEKPISLGVFTLPKDANIQMVNQYAFTGPWPEGVTYYNNWNTGKDGLEWDCINIIGLARGEVVVENNSPFWKCAINGKELTLHDIDMGYIKMIEAWAKRPEPNIDYILKAHDKVRRYRDTSYDRHTGAKH